VNKDDLLRMLDLSGKEAAPEKAEELAITPVAAATAPASAEPTALELDDWGLRRGREVLQESERLQALALGEHAVADFFGAAFEPEPKLREGCADPRRHDFLRQLLGTPDYQALHTTTLLNQAASALAAAAFAEQFAALKEEEKEDAGASGPGGAGGADAVGREMATLRAVGQALAKATEEVGELREAAAALGLGPGSPGSNDPRAIAALYRRVRSSPTLRRICELAGRYRRVAQSKQRRKVAHGSDDVVGVTLDGDPGRALPHELAKLSLPEFEDDALRRLVERQLMSREHRSVEPVAKGPVIVVADESGSMCGEKAHTAKALALALAWIARQQKRWIALAAYSGDTGERLLALPPGRWDEAALLGWLCAFLGGGSSLDVPVKEMPRYYEQLRAPKGVTDVIFITDAICRLPAGVRDDFLAWKKQAQARLITLVIQSTPGDLSAISDEVHQVGSLDVSEAGVERVLSL
jgi:uncharacterized protein with von Willebrand factor type A (vWA) domain